jgi:hypothetical protein
VGPDGEVLLHLAVELSLSRAALPGCKQAASGASPAAEDRKIAGIARRPRHLSAVGGALTTAPIGETCTGNPRRAWEAQLLMGWSSRSRRASCRSRVAVTDGTLTPDSAEAPGGRPPAGCRRRSSRRGRGGGRDDLGLGDRVPGGARHRAADTDDRRPRAEELVEHDVPLPEEVFAGRVLAATSDDWTASSFVSTARDVASISCTGARLKT